MPSPYVDLPVGQWRAKTQELVANHPLSLEDIRAACLRSWDFVWETTIGTGETAISLREIEVPSTVTGYFFERILARELEVRHPGRWRGGQEKAEKDLVYVSDPHFSIEVKTSGQLNTRVYGNRSYGMRGKTVL